MTDPRDTDPRDGVRRSLIGFDWREPLARAERERRSLSESQRRRADRQCLFVVVSACLLLTWQHYGAEYLQRLRFPQVVEHRVPGREPSRRSLGDDRELHRLLLWAGNTTFAYLLAPLALSVLVLRRSAAEMGCKLRGAGRGFGLYLAMLALMLPMVGLLSGTEAFQQIYPFYRSRPIPPATILLTWELAYALQFVAVEFFFRGYLLHGTREALGPHAVLASLAPYCMIHFGKPLPETLGAIAAGLALGYMSLWLRSIWLGAGLHIGVAWTMDAAVLLRRSAEFPA